MFNLIQIPALFRPKTQTGGNCQTCQALAERVRELEDILSEVESYTKAIHSESSQALMGHGHPSAKALSYAKGQYEIACHVLGESPVLTKPSKRRLNRR